MTVLKWWLGIVAGGYLCGLAVLYAVQRKFLFPIPTVMRMAPASAGFSEAEEHVLTTADDEKVIVWYVAARPGHDVVLFFMGTAALSRAASAASRA